MNRTLRLLSALIFFGVTSIALIYNSPTHLFAAELDGKTLYTKKLCQTCHGIEGKKPIAPNYPKLNGQNWKYAFDQMKMIRDKKRTGGLTASMQAITVTVTDDEFKAIAQYLEKVK